MDQNNSIIPHQQNGLLPRVANSLEITNKILAKPEERLIPYRKKDKWGFCTHDKKIVIDCEFDLVHRFSEGLASIKRKGLWGFVDIDGRFVIEPKYLNARPFREGIAAVLNEPEENSWIFIDSNRNCIFSNFEYLSDFNEGYASIGIVESCYSAGKYGFIDKSGSIKIPIEFDYDLRDTPDFIAERIYGQMEKTNSCLRFSDGYVCLEKNMKYGFFDKNGEMLVPFCYDAAFSFSGGLAEVGIINPNISTTAKSGYIDCKGKLVIPLKYYFASTLGTRFSEGLALVKSPNYGKFYINQKDEIIIPVSNIEFLTGFSEGLATVKKDGKYGFINKQGEIKIDCIYDHFNFSKAMFSNGLCKVKLEGNTHFIDNLGKKVIDCKSYINYGNFNNGLSYCSIHPDGNIQIFSGKTKNGYIDKNGTEFWED